MRRSPNPFERGGCTTANYRLLPSGYVEVLNTEDYNENSKRPGKGEA
jgi:hypothetical protein